MKELDADRFGCSEEPGSCDWCVGAELIGVKTKADVLDPSEEWCILTSPSVLVSTGLIFGVNADVSEIVADGITELLTPGIVFR